MRLIEPPIQEVWTLGDHFPESIEIEGTTFMRALRAQPYEGVIAQYREGVPRNSMHLLVMNDGSWVIDHVDEYNPDMGYPIRHFIVDHPAGKSLLVAGVGLVGVAGAVIAGAMQNKAVKDDGSPY